MNVLILMTGDEWDGREGDLKAVYASTDLAYVYFTARVREMAADSPARSVLDWSDAQIVTECTKEDGSLRFTVGDDYVSLTEHTAR